MKKLSILLSLLLAVVTASAASWSNESDYNNGVNLQQSKGNEVYFVVPGQNGNVNLISRDGNVSLHKNGTLTLTYKIRVLNGKPQFKSLDPAPAPPSLKPNMRWMLFNGDWMDNNGRFWPSGANCAWLIADGKIHTYTVKLDPKLWSNVYGKFGAGPFQAILAHPQIFLAFGGGNSFSHGVNEVGGSAVVVIISVKIL